MEGGAGNDVYVFGAGHGHDTVQAFDGAAGRHDVIRLVGLDLEDIVFGSTTALKSGYLFQNLVVRVVETGETLTVMHGADSYGVEYIRSRPWSSPTGRP
jgi:Ca2+-binding RTX toxin-like protein